MKRTVGKVLLATAMTVLTISTGCSGTKTDSAKGNKVESQSEKSYDPSKIDDKKMISVNGGSFKATKESGKITPLLSRIERDSAGTVIFHTIQISPFQIAAYETTWELWSEVVAWATSDERGSKKYSFEKAGWNGCDNTGDQAYPESENKKYPVVNMGWGDILVWLNAYSEMNGLTPCYYDWDSNVLRSPSFDVDFVRNNGYRLPSEVEWEWAARGANPSAEEWNYNFAGSNDADKVAWFAFTGETTQKYRFHSVGMKQPNSLGLFDMSGNARECTNDSYIETRYLPDEAKGVDPIVDPCRFKPRSETYGSAVARSCFFKNKTALNQNGLDESDRVSLTYAMTDLGIGFRVARSDK